MQEAGEEESERGERESGVVGGRGWWVGEITSRGSGTERGVESERGGVWMSNGVVSERWAG